MQHLRLAKNIQAALYLHLNPAKYFKNTITSQTILLPALKADPVLTWDVNNTAFTFTANILQNKWTIINLFTVQQPKKNLENCEHVLTILL